MLKRISQKIVTLASKLIHQSVLITDTDGIVVGSSDPSRVGCLHEASVEVMKNKASMYHDHSMAETLSGTFAGVTLPIEFGNGIVGTVGITGDPSEVSQYGLLLKMFVEMLLKDNLGQHLNSMRERECLSLVREIINLNDEEDAHMVLTHGYTLGYELNISRMAVFIQFVQHHDHDGAPTVQLNHDSATVIKETFSSSQDICVSISPDSILILATTETTSESNMTAAIKSKCEGLVKRLKEINTEVYIGIGGVTHAVEELRKSYEDAYRAMLLCKNLEEGEGVLAFSESVLGRLITSISLKSYRNYFSDYVDLLMKKKDSEEIIKVIKTWCESSFNSSETSQKLFIHKNTLAYRIERIKRISGLDLHEFCDAAILYIAVSLGQLYKDNDAYPPPL